MPASVAQWDVRQNGDQEVTGSIPAGSATFFPEDWSSNIFYTVILPLLLIQEGQLSVSGKKLYVRTG